MYAKFNTQVCGALPITNVVANPKRPNSASYTRFALYQEGMTVAQALAAGVLPADIRWDLQRNFITVALFPAPAPA